jgi:hypothetical protein
MRIIREEFEDDERAVALATYLDIEVDDITNNGGTSYETPDGEEYLVVTEDEARDIAEESIQSIFDDLGLESFTETFQDWIQENALNSDWFEDAMRESFDSYVSDIESEDSDTFDNRLIEELFDNELLTIDDFEQDEDEETEYPTGELKDDVDLESLKERYIDKLCDQDAIDWYRDNFGDADLREVLKENPNIIDMETVVDRAIDVDGIAHFIATYDGDEIELDNGYYAYRTN